MAKLKKTVFHLEDKAARETFRNRREAFPWLSENARSLSGCFCVKTAMDGTVKISRNARAVACMAVHFSYTLALTDRRGCSAEQILLEYRSRDMVEKLFDSLKNEDGQHRLRTGVDESTEGRLFLAFISLILRASLEKKCGTQNCSGK